MTNNEVFRFDSNYFLKKFLQDENLIRSKKFDKLKNLSKDIKSFGAYSLNNEVQYLESGIPFIRGVDMKKGIINFDNVIFISENANKLLWKSEIKPEMVLLSMSGTIGDVAIASKNWNYPINSSQDLAKIDTNWLINPYFLYCFLLTKFGQNYLKREARGSVQQHVFLSQIEQLEIPILESHFINQIENLVNQAHSKLEQSKSLYTSAENLLLEALGLNNFEKLLTSEKINTNIKNLSASFLATGRLDAEYYQPKYERLEEKIKIFGSKRLDEICNLFDTNFQPKENVSYSYIELSDIGSSGEITGCMQELGQDLPTRARRLVNKGDVIISSIEGSLSKCALITENYDKALCSTGFYVINSKNITSETLLVFLKSELAQSLMKKACSGTILTSMNKDEFLNILVPILPMSIQQDISEKIQSSFSLRSESERLLALAKEAVEVAIEKGEAEAMGIISI